MSRNIYLLTLVLSCLAIFSIGCSVIAGPSAGASAVTVVGPWHGLGVPKRDGWRLGGPLPARGIDHGQDGRATATAVAGVESLFPAAAPSVTQTVVIIEEKLG